ncbi:uncharacterized protein LOC113334241 [Papaver somniferum]|uniref:uncharacterized protein LOC113334241 n=1 Tax=Papaver somniferum TaxID=3469 RepID=UPI000E6FBD6F|nr:uncharacterized protein LOC113334241 [Papaver somniferum]XP_026436356.1 uncharacterized protein LOC113334241 [Papaver somniferum]XP_026436358.1 uncharacterized protein LOC113334241 [Papaver somniferum]XP_026436359.1 uncharacterized protein LOC113334241 [Papaver somniferum]XP_026436360.1 uncharacterized protein LOC113334241 [Papaver somniferum]XP_026436361.1 uncharacterized protein LOC113334241 [Papaver somniferum]
MMAMKARWGISNFKAGRVHNQMVRKNSNLPKSDKPEVPKSEKPVVVTDSFGGKLDKLSGGGVEKLLQDTKWADVIAAQVRRFNKMTQIDSIPMKQLGRFLQFAAAFGVGQAVVDYIYKYFKPETSLRDILDAVEECKTCNLKSDIMEMKESLVQLQILMKNAAKQSPTSENGLKGDLQELKDGMVRVERYLKISANRPLTYQPRAVDFSRRLGEAPTIPSKKLS